MVSLTAGSPSCNCENPDTCIHAFSLKVKYRTFDYSQDDFVTTVETIDKTGEGVPVSLGLTGKGCVSHNPLCPHGIIYDSERRRAPKTFSSGLTNYVCDYGEKADIYSTHDAIDFLREYVFAKDIKALLPKEIYTLRVGQCNDEPFISESLVFLNGVSQIFSLPSRDALRSQIIIYPAFSWDVSVMIGTDETVTEFTERQKKKQAKEENKANGNPQRGARGWTKRPNYEISRTLEIGGEFTYTLGNNPEHNYSASMKKDFKRKANTLSWLSKSVKTVDFISKTLSTTKGENDKITLLETEIIYPALEIKAKGELKEDSTSGEVYIERELSLGLTPLIGIKMTLDLLQAFAAWYRADVLLAAVREKLMSQEQAYQEGGNAAFFGTKFWLVAEGDLNFTLVFKSDAKNEWEWQKDESAEATLTLTTDANVRAGVRFYIAEGALDIGGKAVAKGCLGLHAPTKDTLDLVFYHEGITAKVYVKYTVGLSSSSEDSADDSADVSEKNPTNKTSDQSKQAEKEWVIHDKLEKSDSEYRFSLI
ncbi:hypothetical protein PSR30_11070 [Pectobacterium carotovorum subsp. carotovorum]|uniref:hypothetical protein n=1 Tax=Pectobacterium carotovorum TaxID=554 RepID=UPI0023657A1A|nr:hypothetical protein [Pectobacterium carotovorum]WDF96987.1 hypothetical protein PSR30_11070 [Pectobacterium carotovorum subsp. carotovorum]